MLYSCLLRCSSEVWRLQDDRKVKPEDAVVYMLDESGRRLSFSPLDTQPIGTDSQVRRRQNAVDCADVKRLYEVVPVVNFSEFKCHDTNLICINQLCQQLWSVVNHMGRTVAILLRLRG